MSVTKEDLLCNVIILSFSIFGCAIITNENIDRRAKELEEQIQEVKEEQWDKWKAIKDTPISQEELQDEIKPDPKNDPARNPTSEELLEDESEEQESFGFSYNEKLAKEREDVRIAMLERWKKKGCN